MTQRFDDWSTTAASNTTVGSGSINIAEGMAPSNVNNAMRDIMASAALSFGGFPEGSARPSIVAAGSMWLDTTTSSAPIVKLYDGTDDITVMTFNYTANTVAFSAFNIVTDTTPQLGGNLDVNGKTISSASNGNVDIDPNGTGTIILGAAAVLMEGELQHVGDTNNKIGFTTDTQTFTTGGTTRMDITDSGVKVGTGARVTTILDEDAMGTDSNTALATQQSIKAYADTKGITRGTAKTPTSGTTVDFTGIAAGTDLIHVMFFDVSLNGDDDMMIRLGDSGGFEDTGYNGSAGNRAGELYDATGFMITRNMVNADAVSGIITLARINGNSWTLSGNVSDDDSTAPQFASGSKTLTAELTQIRITTNGSNQFAAGTINILTE